MTMNDLPEYIEGLPNISGAEKLCAEAVEPTRGKQSICMRAALILDASGAHAPLPCICTSHSFRRAAAICALRKLSAISNT